MIEEKGKGVTTVKIHRSKLIQFRLMYRVRFFVCFRVELLNYDLITMLFKILSIETKQEKGRLTIFNFFGSIETQVMSLSLQYRFVLCIGC